MEITRVLLTSVAGNSDLIAKYLLFGLCNRTEHSGLVNNMNNWIIITAYMAKVAFYHFYEPHISANTNSLKNY